MFHLKIHHYHHFDEDDVERLDRIQQTLDNLMEQHMAISDDLLSAVDRNTSAQNSVEQLLAGISQTLKDTIAANADGAALRSAVTAAITKLDAGTAEAAAAVVANTAAAPVVVADPAAPPSA